MKRHLSQEEINKAKASEPIRNDIISRIEKVLAVGKTRQVTVDGPDVEDDYKMEVYRMTRRKATEDAIRQFCDAIDEMNPLYRSRDYAKTALMAALLRRRSFWGP